MKRLKLRLQICTFFKGEVSLLNGAVAQQSYNQGFNWIHADHLGSGHKMTNTGGTVVFTEQYDPHGQKLMQTLNNGPYYLSKKFTGY